MDDTERKKYQKALLDLYKFLCETLKKEGQKIDSGLKATQKNISAEKFLLAIIGEGKAGKSTFINAILGEAILPVHTLQATSAIVEVYKSNKKEVQATFVNREKKVVKGDQTVTFLKQIASVDSKYRNIPFVQVNRFLIKKYDKEKREAVFKKGELEDFISDPELENIHNLDRKTFRNKIREYIEKNILCDKIPKRITLGLDPF